MRDHGMDLGTLKDCLRFVEVGGKKKLQVATRYELRDGEAIPGYWVDVTLAEPEIVSK